MHQCVRAARVRAGSTGGAIVAPELRPFCAGPQMVSNAAGPGLLIACDVSRALYRMNRGYIVSEQGKPPDFVPEVASASN